MKQDALKSLLALQLLGSSAAWAISSAPVLLAPRAASEAIIVRHRTLPTHGTTHDADGKILAFSMPGLIEVEHAPDGATMTVRPVRSNLGNGMVMEVVGQIPPSATGTYSGLLRVSFDYN